MDIDRSGRLWRVREGNYYLFHLEPPLDEDVDLAACLAEADERYPLLRRLLGQQERSETDRERFFKGNYWLFGKPWQPPEEMRPEPEPAGPARRARGEMTPAGIAFGQQGFGWSDLNDQLAHEEVHLAWTAEVGSAPFLLNEGVATWFELRLSHRDRMGELLPAWAAVIGGGGWRLGDLARNDRFAAAYRANFPVYLVGAALAGHLIDTVGLDALKDVFRSVSGEDEDLAARLEARLGRSMATLEAEVGAWLAEAIAPIGEEQDVGDPRFAQLTTQCRRCHGIGANGQDLFAEARAMRSG